MNGNQIFHCKGIFLNIQQAGSPKINNAEAVHSFYHFANTVIFRAGAVIDQISRLDIIVRPSVIGIDHRKPFKPI